MTTPTPPPPPPGTTHSPGPWRIHWKSQSGPYLTIKAADGRTVARVPRNPEKAPSTDRTDTNNAQAISLLPELLATLEDMVTCFGGHSDALARQHLAQARAIIAKARGQ